MLVEEFLRAGVDVDFKRRKFIDVQNIFHKKEQRTLVAAYKFYCDKDLKEAHSAEADTKATYEVLKAQLDRYDDLENDIDKLAEYSCRAEAADYAGRILYNEKGEEVFGFGKYKGRSVAEVFRIEPSYYAWMMNGDFPLYTKKVITEIRMRNKTEMTMKRLCATALTIAWALCAVAAEKSGTIVYINGCEVLHPHRPAGGNALRTFENLRRGREGDPRKQPFDRPRAENGRKYQDTSS